MSLGEFLPSSSTKLLLHLNGNSNDSSGLGNNGTDTAITYSQANGKFGVGAGFNGSSSKIVCSQIAGLNRNFTISLWIKTSGTIDSYDSFVSQNQGGTPAYGFLFGWYSTTGRICFTRPALSSIILTDNTYNDNVWHNAIFTIDNNSTANVAIYVDGVLVKSGTTTEALTVSGNLVIGADGTDGTYGFYNGYLDELIIENVAWSAEKVKKYYTYSKGRFGL